MPRDQQNAHSTTGSAAASQQSQPAAGSAFSQTPCTFATYPQAPSNQPSFGSSFPQTSTQPCGCGRDHFDTSNAQSSTAAHIAGMSNEPLIPEDIKYLYLSGKITFKQMKEMASTRASESNQTANASSSTPHGYGTFTQNYGGGNSQ